jgi:hypothetical protein
MLTRPKWIDDAMAALTVLGVQLLVAAAAVIAVKLLGV